MGTALFDRIAVVDWSANAAPKQGADSIWIALVDGERCEITNPSTRHRAIQEVLGFAQPGRRTLVGVDFSLGYPAGTAAAAGLAGVPWQAMWSHLGSTVSDDERNLNNRFAVASDLNVAIRNGLGDAARPGPFWGCPPRQATTSLTTSKPAPRGGWPPQWRLVESEMRSLGHRPFSSWQLLGAGAVGGQTLVGVAALERLRSALGDRLSIWPFSTGLRAPTEGELVVAEVWPSLWDVEVPVGTVKDAAQVEATARRLSSLDRRGELTQWFSPPLDPEWESTVVGEEGWVLGVDGPEIGGTAG